jgi:carbon-monoxide dehydrogenase medium subunit
MASPRYLAPESLEDALRIKSERGSDVRVIAGGTDLILRMRDRVHSPELLIDLRRVPLGDISQSAGELRIGSYASQSQILADEEIAASFPALTEACRPFAGPPIRNRATIGGNIVNASPAADLVPPLLAYDATVVLHSISGERELPLAGFFTGPGQTVMNPDEILTQIRLPLPPARSAAHFIKLGHRRSMAIAIVNLCTRISLAEDGSVATARIALGAVAPTVVRAVGAETALTGRKFSDDLIAEAAELACGQITPISDVRGTSSYRKRMAGVLVRRALGATRDELERENADG